MVNTPTIMPMGRLKVDSTPTIKIAFSDIKQNPKNIQDPGDLMPFDILNNFTMWIDLQMLV